MHRLERVNEIGGNAVGDLVLIGVWHVCSETGYNVGIVWAGILLVKILKFKVVLNT